MGRHLPPSAERLPQFMDYFVMRYRGLSQGATGRILSIPAAHHRLNYIHPFLDGNGRVSRLMSHAMCQAAGLGGHGLWSISRGLARGLADPAEYKERMDTADRPRQGDRNGRGNLSLNALTSFTGWFLTVMLDQIRFTEAMFDLRTLQDRYTRLIADLYPGKDRLPQLITHVLRHGEMARGDARFVTGVSERSASTDLGELIKGGLLKSAGSVLISVYLSRPMRFQIFKRRSARQTLWRTRFGPQTIPGHFGHPSRSRGWRGRSAWWRLRPWGRTNAS